MNQTELEEFFKDEPVQKKEKETEYIFKIKPVWLFQSIEVEVKATQKQLPKVMDLYSDILAGLMKIAPEQKREVNETRPTVKLATESQKMLMRKFDIPFTADTTAAEAQKLIQASVDRANK